MSDPIHVVNPENHRAGALRVGAGLIIFFIFFALASLIGGEPRQIAAASLNAVPFAILAILAYLGGRQFNWAWLASGLWLLIMIALTALVGLGFGIASVTGGLPASSGSPAQISLDGWIRIGLIALGSLGVILISATLLITPVRRRLAHVIPIDPDSFVHTIALLAVVPIGALCFVPLAVLGAPPLLSLVGQLTEANSGRDTAGLIRDQLYGLIWTIPATILAVGYGVRRNLREALARLGLVRPSWRQVIGAVVLAVFLALAMQFIGTGLDWLWKQLGWPVTNDEAFGELISFAFNPIGAVVLGISAGLGEELAVRGVLQPRLGLLLSNLFFTSLHALQYNWDALLVVFLVGTICGLVRKYNNTTTAAIVHGTYNFSLIMFALILGG